MELEDLIARRREPNAGLYVALTQRCPMSCAHCSTNSSLRAPHEPRADLLEAFFASMDRVAHPSVTLFTGGEPLMRAPLLARLARRARELGGRTYAITGGFWVRRPTSVILDALDTLDVVSFSYDRFHAPEVDRAALLGGIEMALERGCAVAVQTVLDPLDPDFTEAFLDDLGARFRGRVPVFVSPLSAQGRARSLPQAGRSAGLHDAPCMLASWPVVTYTGWVVACCQHETIAATEPPEHLRLGRLGSCGYPEVARRNRRRIALRAVRGLGPGVFSKGGTPNGGYCAPCLGYDGDEGRLRRVFRERHGRMAERVMALSSPSSSIPVLRPGAP